VTLRLLSVVARVALTGALVAGIGSAAALQQSSGPEPVAAAAPTHIEPSSPAEKSLGDVLSSRSEFAGRLQLERTPAVTFNVVADGATVAHTTRAATLAEALAEAGITVDGDDVASAALGAPVRAGMTVTIQRVEVTEVSEEVVDPHQSTRVNTSELYEGTEKVTTEGVDGLARHTYRVTMIDGVEVSREILLSAVARERVDEVVSVGTRKKPAPSTTSVGTTGPILSGTNREIGASLAAQRGWTGSQWTCLDLLWTRESRWNHLAVNPSSGAYGIPQALPGSKMATVADDWRTNPATQIIWGLNYIAGRYGTPCGAWSHSESYGWY